MAKPTMTVFPDVDADTSSAEKLNDNFEALADKFDGNIVDSDVSSLSWSKITGVSISNSDIAVGADIDGAKIEDLGIDTLQLAANAVTIAKITNGTNFKLQGEATDSAVADGANSTDQTLSTLSVSSAEDTNGKFIAIGFAEITRTNNSGRVTMGIDIDGTPFTVRPSFYIDNNHSPRWMWAIAEGAATTSAIDVKLIAKGDGLGLTWSHTAGNGYLMVLTFNRIS